MTTTIAPSFTATIVFCDYSQNQQSTISHEFATYERAIQWVNIQRVQVVEDLLSVTVVPTPPAPTALQITIAELKAAEAARELDSMLARDWTQPESPAEWSARLSRKLARGVRP
jgi:hypothetical protein